MLFKKISLLAVISLVIPQFFSGIQSFKLSTTALVILPGLIAMFLVGLWWQFWGREYWSSRIPTIYPIVLLFPILSYIFYACHCYIVVNQRAVNSWLLALSVILQLAWLSPVIASAGKFFCENKKASRILGSLVVLTLVTPYLFNQVPSQQEGKQVQVCSEQKDLMESYPVYYPMYHLIFQNRVCGS